MGMSIRMDIITNFLLPFLNNISLNEIVPPKGGTIC